MLSARPGLTLVELCIALTLGSLALCTITVIGARQQRLHLALAQRLAGARQLRHAAEILPIDLRAIDASEGDIVAGEARDSSIQFRATVAGGVICAVTGAEVALVPADARDGELYSALSSPRVGDTLWALADADSSQRWIPAGIVSSRTAAGRCAAGSAFVAPAEALAASVVLSLSRDVGALGIGIGSPVRVTRLARYSIYHASDGGWYLGFRDAAAGGGFDVIQPVSGPYPSRTSFRFRYWGDSGAPLPLPIDSTRRVLAVEITLAALAGDVGAAAAGLPRAATSRVDSLDILVGLRNTP
jgi:hypothetical protein